MCGKQKAPDSPNNNPNPAAQNSRQQTEWERLQERPLQNALGRSPACVLPPVIRHLEN